jgi:hypothetical protein
MSFRTVALVALSTFLVSCTKKDIAKIPIPVRPMEYSVPITLQEDQKNKVYGDVTVDLLSGDVHIRLAPHTELVIDDVRMVITDPKMGTPRGDMRFGGLRADLGILYLHRIFPPKECDRPVDMTADLVAGGHPAMSLRTVFLTIRVKTRCLKKKD